MRHRTEPIRDAAGVRREVRYFHTGEASHAFEVARSRTRAFPYAPFVLALACITFGMTCVFTGLSGAGPEPIATAVAGAILLALAALFLLYIRYTLPRSTPVGVVADAWLSQGACPSCGQRVFVQHDSGLLRCGECGGLWHHPRLHVGVCPTCGFSLEGLDHAHVCPECGNPVDSHYGDV